MRLTLAGLCLLVWATGATALEDAYGIKAPPARYMTGPLITPLTIRLVPVPTLRAICAPFNHDPRGCAYWSVARDDRWCDIFIRDDQIADDLFNLILQHELAHCRGWPGHHPD